MVCNIFNYQVNQVDPINRPEDHMNIHVSLSLSLSLSLSFRVSFIKYSEGRGVGRPTRREYFHTVPSMSSGGRCLSETYVAPLWLLRFTYRGNKPFYWLIFNQNHLRRVIFPNQNSCSLPLSNLN